MSLPLVYVACVALGLGLLLWRRGWKNALLMALIAFAIDAAFERTVRGFAQLALTLGLYALLSDVIGRLGIGKRLGFGPPPTIEEWNRRQR